jgi:hypothetical protein
LWGKSLWSNKIIQDKSRANKPAAQCVRLESVYFILSVVFSELIAVLIPKWRRKARPSSQPSCPPPQQHHHQQQQQMETSCSGSWSGAFGRLSAASS